MGGWDLCVIGWGMRSGFSWLRIGIVGGFVWTRWWAFVFWCHGVKPEGRNRGLTEGSFPIIPWRRLVKRHNMSARMSGPWLELEHLRHDARVVLTKPKCLTRILGRRHSPNTFLLANFLSNSQVKFRAEMWAVHSRNKTLNCSRLSFP
jgi:hypothetical protein